MKFSNRENERVELHDGRVIYLSRSVAVAIQLHAIIDNEQYVLICKRGPEAMGGAGKWCLPCGYLDWDESGEQAVIRELWEETNVSFQDFIFDIHSKVKISHLHHPWKVVSDPQIDERQNVTLHHGTVVIRTNTMLPTPSIKNAELGELEDVRWIKISELDSYDFAFNHNSRIKEFINLCII